MGDACHNAAMAGTGPQPRQVYQRRRLAALGMLVLAIVVIGAATGAARHAPRKHAVAVHRVARPASPDAQAKAARQQQAIAKVLAYTSYIARGSARHREVALTFDDGPGPYTPQVLAVLRRHRAPATFFVVGRSLVDFGASLPQEIDGGYVIGDHTQDHRLLTQLSRRDQTQQIYEQAQDLLSYQAPFPRLFRPPYGGFNDTTLALLRRYGMLMVLWSVDTHDYLQPGTSTIVARALAGAQPGAIILMHDAGGPRSQTIAALPQIIAGIRRRHLKLVTVPRLVTDDPPPLTQPPPRSLAGGAG
jgi:peptidoglycan/xylan/chitin deacetylase (PgdA/CDA1 family)